MTSRSVWFLSGVLLVGVLMALGASAVGAIVLAIVGHVLHEAWIHASSIARHRREARPASGESQRS